MSSSVIDILRAVSKKTGSKAAKEKKEEEAYRAARDAAHMLFDQFVEEHCEGEVVWKEGVRDLAANLLAIDMPEPPDVSEDRRVAQRPRYQD